MRTYIGTICVVFLANYCHYGTGFARPEEAFSEEPAKLLPAENNLLTSETVQEVKNASEPNDPSQVLGSEAENREKRGYSSPQPYRTHKPSPPSKPLRAPAYPTVPAFVTPSNIGRQAAAEVFGQCAIGLSEELIKIVRKYETKYCPANLLVAQQTLYMLWTILRNIRIVLLKHPQPHNCLHVTSGGVAVELALENIQGQMGVVIRDFKKLDNQDPFKKAAYGAPAAYPKNYDKKQYRKKRDNEEYEIGYGENVNEGSTAEEYENGYETEEEPDLEELYNSPKYRSPETPPAPPAYMPKPEPHYPEAPTYSKCSVLTWEEILTKNNWKENVFDYCKGLAEAKAKTLGGEDIEDFRLYLECDLSSLRLAFEEVISQAKFNLPRPQAPKKDLGYYRSPAPLSKRVREIIYNTLLALNGLLKPAYSSESKPTEVCYLADQYNKARYCYDGQVCAYVWKKSASGKCSDAYTIDGTCLEARCVSKCAFVTKKIAPCLDSKYPQSILEEKLCPADSSTYPKGTSKGCIYSPVCAKQILTFGTGYSYSFKSDEPGKFLKGSYTRVTRWLTPQYKDCVVAQAGASKPATCNSNEQCLAVTVPSRPNYSPAGRKVKYPASTRSNERHRRSTPYGTPSYSYESACLPVDEDCKPRREKDFCNSIRCTGTCSKVKDVDCKKRTSGNPELKWLLTPLSSSAPSNNREYKQSYPTSYPAKFADLTCRALPSCSPSKTYGTPNAAASSYPPAKYPDTTSDPDVSGRFIWPTCWLCWNSFVWYGYAF